MKYFSNLCLVKGIFKYWNYFLGGDPSWHDDSLPAHEGMGSGSVRGRLDADPAAGMLDLPVQDGEAPRLALAVGGRKSQS